jgi:hypothetical protein
MPYQLMTSNLSFRTIASEVLGALGLGIPDEEDASAYSIHIDANTAIRMQLLDGRMVMSTMLPWNFGQCDVDHLQALLALNQPGDTFPPLLVSIESESGNLMLWTFFSMQELNQQQIDDTFARLVSRSHGIVGLLNAGVYNRKASEDGVHDARGMS